MEASLAEMKTQKRHWAVCYVTERSKSWKIPNKILNRESRSRCRYCVYQCTLMLNLENSGDEASQSCQVFVSEWVSNAASRCTATTFINSRSLSAKSMQLRTFSAPRDPQQAAKTDAGGKIKYWSFSSANSKTLQWNCKYQDFSSESCLR